MDSRLGRLAELIRRRNSIEVEIAEITHRPASIGHLGEYIAAEVFDIELAASASNKGYDGWFRTGDLTGKTVNVKWYARREGLLDVNPEAIPDLYLVFAGPRANSIDKATRTRSWIIQSVHLFDTQTVFHELKGHALGIGTSVPAKFWNESEIYPRVKPGGFVLTESQRAVLGLFSGVESPA